MKNAGRRYRVLLGLLSGVAVALSTALHAQVGNQPLVTFCWADTWGRGAGTIPASCGNNSEHNGALCYATCPAGYTSNGVDDCIQNCPAGFHDDGLFCSAGGDTILKPYTVFVKDQCPKENPQGCFQDAALWYPNCPQGKKYSGAGVCVPNVDCGSLNPPMGARVANSCTKKIQIRPPSVASCASGQDTDAGLCYTACVNGIGEGPLCRAKAPSPGATPGSTWVTCGAGYAWDQASCNQALTDQVISVVESAIETTLLLASLGASAAETDAIGSATKTQNLSKLGTVDKFTNSFKSLKNLKSIYKAAKPGDFSGPLVKNIGKGALSKVVNAPTIVQSGLDGGFSIADNISQLDQNNLYPTDKEIAVAKADMALNIIGIVDPTGVAGIAAAYTKPTCGDIGEAKASSPPPLSGPLASLVLSGTVEKNFKNQIEDLDNRIGAEQKLLAAAQQQAQSAPPAARAAVSATVAKKQALLTTLTTRRDKAVAASAKFDGYRAQYASIASSASASTLPAREPPQAHEASVGGWNSLGAVARDVAVGANGTMWYIGAGASGSADGPIYRMGPQGPQEMPGTAQRIAVDPNGNAWVVNSSGAIFKWSGSAWQNMPGTASDIGIGANGAVWVTGGNQTIWRWTGSNWTQMPGSGAVRVSVDPNGDAWVVNAQHQIYRYVNNAWQLMIGAATDVGVGADGTVYVIGVDQSAAGGQLYHWDPKISNWAAEPGAVGSSVAAGRAGVVYVARAPRSGLPILAKMH